jgi:hypothetical protein
MRPVVILLLAWVALVGCTPREVARDGGLRTTMPSFAGSTPTLVNGPAPQSAAEFDQLRSMGIRTIISVDGATPPVELARARGLRYVHIPLGYHGISPEQQLHLARAVRDLPGPVYIHCHHGKHRGPAALASAAIVLGLMTPEAGIEFLERSGTSHEYPGLYACVEAARPATPEELHAAAADFPEVVPMPGFVRAMVEVGERFDHLGAIRESGWATPARHPDLVPLAEAARLENLLRVLPEDAAAPARGPEFLRLLLASAGAAQHLERGIAANGADLDARYAALAASCKACHTRYRNYR